MLQLPLHKHQILGPLSILVASIALFLLGESTTAALVYQRDAVQNLELWRLITGDLLHTNGVHLLLNLVGLGLLWALHGDYYKTLPFINLLGFCALVCGAGIYFFSPELIWYVGLSGALHGVFVWGACVDIQRRLYSGWLLLAGLGIKVGYEQLQGPSADLGRWINAQVAVDAHLYGAIGGLLYYLLSRLLRLLITHPSPQTATKGEL